MVKHPPKIETVKTTNSIRADTWRIDPPGDIESDGKANVRAQNRLFDSECQ
jgi:hypothetical protein